MVFNLKYYQEMKYEEMSDIFGTSVGALKASYPPCREENRKVLGEGVLNLATKQCLIKQKGESLWKSGRYPLKKR